MQAAKPQGACAAAGTGAVLLFDEADSLFASRIEASTAQDRSNNMITSLLLQEIEEYTGVVILTTNLKEHFDDAFERRMLFSVEFPMPELDQRRAIWATLLPPEAPVAKDLDFDDLARRFEFAGGDIKKCLLRAAMSAQAAGAELDQNLLKRTCIDEYSQSGRLVPP
jgi:SpoVK/Ycf46/Vps4 family AAA+-type ATPase